MAPYAHTLVVKPEGTIPSNDNLKEIYTNEGSVENAANNSSSSFDNDDDTSHNVDPSHNSEQNSSGGISIKVEKLKGERGGQRQIEAVGVAKAMNLSDSESVSMTSNYF